jgi:hypothetical protein
MHIGRKNIDITEALVTPSRPIMKNNARLCDKDK